MTLTEMITAAGEAIVKHDPVARNALADVAEEMGYEELASSLRPKQGKEENVYEVTINVKGRGGRKVPYTLRINWRDFFDEAIGRARNGRANILNGSIQVRRL